MNQLLQDVESVLAAADYRVFVPRSETPAAYFEDESVLGVVYVLQTVAELQQSWEQLQDMFLRENGSLFSDAPTKAWNCYSVFLTRDSADGVDRSKLNAIEEDFRGTRKIVGVGVTTPEDAEAVLAPLLPLRHLHLSSTDNLLQDLRKRLGPEGSPIHGLLLDLDLGTVASQLMESS